MSKNIDLTSDDVVADDVSFVWELEVPGNPIPQPRPRVGKHRIYNPATVESKQWKAAVKATLGATQTGVLFPVGVPVGVVIVCHMRRPNSDFKGGIRGCGRLKSNLPLVWAICPDVDNLVKFILDALNGVIYKDDKQVVKLEVLKVLDNIGACEGRTLVRVARFHG